MKISGKYTIFLLLIVLAIVFVVLAALSTGTEGGADDYQHFKIARYAFKYPSLFLDDWGKPIFIFFSSPFAQLGFIGMKIFNILAGSLTAYLLYLILKKRNYKTAIIAPFFLFFAPIYTVLLLSGMTEIFFGFLFVLSIYLFFFKKFILSAIFASFLPIARTEAIILIPFFILAYSFRKEWKSIPFLLTAFCLYGLIGTFFVYHDFFWLIHQNPYKYKVLIYGSGELLHFVKQLKRITGLPLLFLSIPGFILALYNLFKKGINLKNPEFEEILLILLPLATFFAAHSYVWWKGIGASIGLIRVMACIIPLWIFYSVKGFELIFGYLEKYKYTRYAFLTVMAYYVVVSPFKVYAIPVPQSATHRLTGRAASWLQENELEKHKIFYFEPYLMPALEINPYDQKRCNEGVFDRKMPSNGLPDSSIIVWDAQFGPNEGGVPLENLMKDPNLKLLKIFRPEVFFKVLGNHPYEIYILEKFETGNPVGNYAIASKAAAEELSGFESKLILENGFENSGERVGFAIDSTTSHSGKFSVLLDTVREFSLTYQNESKIFPKSQKQILRASIYCKPIRIPEKSSLTLVASLESQGKIYDYHTANLADFFNESGEWTKLQLEYTIPAVKSDGDVLKVYLWLHGKPLINIDDYRIELFYKK
jgi:hypothetical protein